jgi:2-keto-3-deoxy-galactonokinase
VGKPGYRLSKKDQPSGHLEILPFLFGGRVRSRHGHQEQAYLAAPEAPPNLVAKMQHIGDSVCCIFDMNEAVKPRRR